MDAGSIAAVQQAWSKVAPEPAKHGVEILVRLFDKYPETKKFFEKRLDCSSPEAMRSSARMRAHGARVLGGLGGIVNQLQHQDIIDETIFLLAENHVHRNIKGAEFEKITEVMIPYLKEALGADFPPEAEAGFVKMMDMFNKKIATHL